MVRRRCFTNYAVSVSQLYAFFYTPNPPLTVNNGWSIYSPREEFARMGVGSRTKAWRFTDVNKDYNVGARCCSSETLLIIPVQFCATYPSRLVVPARISDSTLQYASRYRTKCRIPTLVYLHWANLVRVLFCFCISVRLFVLRLTTHLTQKGTITRSSQPMVGLTNNRSIQDEKLVEAIFQSHHSPESRGPMGPVYGATATNLIIDARPTTNAMANAVNGAGTENMDSDTSSTKNLIRTSSTNAATSTASKGNTDKRSPNRSACKNTRRKESKKEMREKIYNNLKLDKKSNFGSAGGYAKFES